MAAPPRLLSLLAVHVEKWLPSGSQFCSLSMRCSLHFCALVEQLCAAKVYHARDFPWSKSDHLICALKMLANADSVVVAVFEAL